MPVNEWTLGPATVFVRRQLENCTAADALTYFSAVTTTSLGCAIKVARLVEDQSANGGVSIRTVENVEHTLRPAPVSVWDQPEDCATAGCPTVTQVSAPNGRAVKVPHLIEDQAANWAQSIRAAHERVGF